MKPARLYERVAAQIASKIAAGEFELGARLPSERELAQAFDVSRPTVREAIFALELDGLVEVRMGSGVYVAAPPRGERADQAFHLKLAEATGNSAVFEVVSSLWDARERSPQYRLLTHKAREAGVNPVTDEHADILAAVRSGDPEAARRAMRMHLNRVFESLLKATEVHELEQAQKRIHATRRKFLAH